MSSFREAGYNGYSQEAGEKKIRQIQAFLGEIINQEIKTDKEGGQFENALIKIGEEKPEIILENGKIFFSLPINLYSYSNNFDKISYQLSITEKLTCEVDIMDNSINTKEFSFLDDAIDVQICNFVKTKFNNFINPKQLPNDIFRNIEESPEPYKKNYGEIYLKLSTKTVDGKTVRFFEAVLNSGTNRIFLGKIDLKKTPEIINFLNKRFGELTQSNLENIDIENLTSENYFEKEEATYNLIPTKVISKLVEEMKAEFADAIPTFEQLKQDAMRSKEDYDKYGPYTMRGRPWPIDSQIREHVDTFNSLDFVFTGGTCSGHIKGYDQYNSGEEGTILWTKEEYESLTTDDVKASTFAIERENGKLELFKVFLKELINWPCKPLPKDKKNVSYGYFNLEFNKNNSKSQNLIDKLIELNKKFNFKDFKIEDKGQNDPVISIFLEIRPPDKVTGKIINTDEALEFEKIHQQYLKELYDLIKTFIQG
ncbi:MAG: hypothetical protein A2537_01230 [Candidatus Magasanikbacteria bacterium RIFOXYD2_FULL_36_9]|uniref:Uncharacterized protein n=1 Tax=Candidatus Magasanikbacteria bacterium RIFOXYD2_FULL_36_9 TaxID=1798707 RepID=A0A1F6NYN1_9BACT|nr:MAG: hypothetical protein A2537_01230 [Candidatus Magasanikbacteria bacterium RIFOXYD2_FULL_36_9]